MPFGTFKNPKGPSWTAPDTVKLDLSGTSISFLLPKSNYNETNYADSNKLQYSKSMYEIDIEKKVKQFTSSSNNKKSTTTKLEYDYFLKRIYDFKGIPFIGAATGGLTFRLAAIYNTQSNFAEDCFFKCILDRMEKLHGKQATRNSLLRLYPINWSLLEIDGCIFLSYGVEDLLAQPRNVSAFRFHFTLPINNYIALDFQFDFDDIPKKSGGIDVANTQINKIMQSIKINYKSEHDAQVSALNLQDKFKPTKPIVWENFKKAPKVDYRAPLKIAQL
ncbi:hypothetical protein GCM10007877_32030 [Marinibactrum halimedae]|uniref:Uncharacterized protein n=2 Tax=Marinibactrum halimedae TaxID=1444977 RepID=A0AA37WMU3_9GAMM|nr:hypothetical protein GCM10007877_32030 [Marinibactrum halimedae]